MSEATGPASRFPAVGRRRVSTLAPVKSNGGPVLIATYAATTALAAPLILSPGWYHNETVTRFGILFCIFILLLPAAGLVLATRMIARCKAAADAAEVVDQRTQGLFDDSASLQIHARETLTGYYESQAVTSVSVVDSLTSDALRRAIVDRWEPSSWLVDAHQDELGDGLPLIMMLQRLALQFGILFTFIGLGVAFSSDAFSRSGGVGQIPDMQPLIEALRVKFMASIAGLLSSILLLMLGGLCRRNLSLAIARLEVMVDNILTLAKTMRSDPAFASDFSQIRESMQRIDNRIDGLADGYAKVVSTVRDGVSDLGVARDELKGGLARLLNAQEKVVAEVNRFYGRIVPEAFADEVGQNVRESMTSFAAQLAETGSSLDKLNQAVVSLAEIERARSDQLGRSEAQHREMMAVLRSLQSGARPIFRRKGETGRGGPGAGSSAGPDGSVFDHIRRWFK